MSLTIQQEPTQMNSAYTKLMYSVISTNRNQPQFKYVCDVVDSSGTIVSRLRQGENNVGNAIFNVAIPCRGVLEEDDTLYITNPTASIGKNSPSNIKSYQQFKVKFGCEFGTSPSSSVTLYDGKGAAGLPSVSGSDLVLNRAVWEPWNEQQFISSSTPPVYSNSNTGSVNFYVAELAGANFVDVNLRVNGTYPAGGFGGSGSFEFKAASNADLSAGNGYYTMDIISFGVSSSAHRYSMEIYNMSTNTMEYQSSQGGTLPSGYVSGSTASGPQTLDSYGFTGSLNNVYGVRLNGIPTSSFNAPLFEAWYVANDYTASSDRIRSITYPLVKDNQVGLGSFPNTKAWNIDLNSPSGSIVGTIDQAFPTLQDFSKANIPTITPLPAGNFGSWNWNYQDARINFTGSNPNYSSVNVGRLFLTNWPTPTRFSTVSGVLSEGKNGPLRTISKDDLGTISWYNISGSVSDGSNPAINVRLVDKNTGLNKGNVSYNNAQLDALTPLIRQTGSGADIPFVTCPVGIPNMPTIWPNSGSSWTQLDISVGSGTETARQFWLRDEPCAWQTRTNFAFINTWGVWDFIGLNTPTNKNAIITERDEFLAVNADYNSETSVYSAYNRGFTQYYLGRNYRYNITTDPIPLAKTINMVGGELAVSAFYQELFQSPSVFIQEGYKFIPVNITNSNFKWKTNIKGQKNYQVEIQYELSNQPRSRT